MLMFAEPSGPGQEDWMTFTFKLERLDGTPAEPASFETTVLSWKPGDTIPLGRNKDAASGSRSRRRRRPGAGARRSGPDLKGV
jgi:hypothetical protein